MKYFLLIFLLFSLTSFAGIVLPSRDSDGALITRTKAGVSGWTYQRRVLNFETSLINSLDNDKHDGTDWGDATIKFYDSSDTELTTATSINTNSIKTVVDWEALYDFEIIGGTVTLDVNPSEDVYVWVVAIPDITEAQGGTKIMVSNLNLNFLAAKTTMVFDGRAAKLLIYDVTNHTNKMRLIVKHNSGKNLKMSVAWEHYKQ